LDSRNRRLAILAVRRGAEDFAAKGVNPQPVKQTSTGGGIMAPVVPQPLAGLN
jgi:hypothetical protein